MWPRRLPTEMSCNEQSVSSYGSWWSLTRRINEREPEAMFPWLAPFFLSSRRLIDFNGLELRLCSYWSLIPSPVSSPIKSSLIRHYGPLLMNTTFLPTSQCCVRCTFLPLVPSHFISPFRQPLLRCTRRQRSVTFEQQCMELTWISDEGAFGWLAKE